MPSEAVHPDLAWSLQGTFLRSNGLYLELCPSLSLLPIPLPHPLRICLTRTVMFADVFFPRQVLKEEVTVESRAAANVSSSAT